ncbi:DUF881 domain-containing protein [Clostridium neuense]|uniref:DUF881 domain-containing protein n=1 Tax=Clostridium neuense TaxID=1728934 RepID=A0ABW8TH13_9CLOT
MKKLGSQIAVAAVCCILGFMIAHQLKIVSIQENNENTSRSSTEISQEVDKLSKEKGELQKKVDDLQKQVKGYQSAAADSSTTNKQILDELNKDKMVLGVVDVSGPGVEITITPQNISRSGSADSDSTSDTTRPIKGEDIVDLINELNFSQAEAISVNDNRITAVTGIKSSSGGTDIFIGDDRISPYEKITIKAIGNSKMLYSALSYPGVLSMIPENYKVEYNKVDNIKIKKSSKIIKFDFAKPSNK